MNLFKIGKITLLIFSLALSAPAFSASIVTPAELNAAPVKDVDRTAATLARLKEIKEMNKENLTRAEKRELRKEVKEIRKELKAASNGIYLSVGAIIIIILLLILLL